MTDQELEARLVRAVTRAAPNDLEGVLSRCQEQNGKVIPMTKTKTARPVRWRALIAACLALVLVGGGAGVFYQNANAVASVVSIDVNPSIELRVNKDEKVLSCTPLNEEAHIALGEMNDGKDLEGAKLTVAVNAIVGALVRHGYLDGLSNAILVSVEDKDQQRALRMEEELRSSISEILEAQAPNATLLSQTLTQEAGERVHPISSGKAALVNQIMALSGSTDDDTFDKLSVLTVEELSDLLETGETRVPVGCSGAAWAAQEHAGTLVLSSNVVQDVDPELDKRPAYYKVELVVGGKEYEYKVDAFTGEVLSGPANVLELGPKPSESPAPQETATPDTPYTLLGEENAWAAVCRDLDVSMDNLSYTKCELDYEDGAPHCYELEFCWNGNQYEYEIDCHSGTVLKYEWEACDEKHHGHYAFTGTTTTPPDTSAPLSLIGEDGAWTAVCTHAGCALGDISYSSCELDYEDDAAHCYELEFCWNGNQYEYEIDCYTGAVLSYEYEACHNGLHGCRGSGRHHGWGHH